MNRLGIVSVGLLAVTTACAPLASSNRLTQSLTPTATVEKKEPTVTSTEQVPTQTPSAGASAQTPTKEHVALATPGNKSFQPQLENVSINLDEVVTLLPPDAIPAILPQQARDIMVTAAEAEASDIASQVQVIGVSIGGENRAYPVPFLSRHEIVNTEVGGRRIAVTW
jgi:hypothetical protein